MIDGMTRLSFVASSLSKGILIASYEVKYHSPLGASSRLHSNISHIQTPEKACSGGIIVL